MATQPIPTSEKRALHVNEAATIYGISRSTIYLLMSEGKLRTVKLAGRRLVPRDAIEALLKQGDLTEQAA